MRLFKISALLFAVLLVFASCGDDSSLKLSYQSSPKEAFEDEVVQEAVTGGMSSIVQEIGTYALNDEYSVYFVVMEYNRNSGVRGSAPTVLLMKTKDGKYQYTGISESFFTEVLSPDKDEEYSVASTKLKAGSKTYSFSFMRTEAYEKEAFTDCNIYEESMELDGEEISVTVAISK
ncbi:MAG: hypothetical protein IJB65_02005 [Clostridia bacterium]|nr:hypothetical protein [Clostridia bacterium]